MEILETPRDQARRLAELVEVYGSYWSRRVYLGGLLVKTINEEHDTGETSLVIGGDERAGQNEGFIGNSQLRPSLQWLWFVTRRAKIAFIFQVWIDSLYDWEHWRAIEYDNLHSIFEIFERDIQEKILGIFGERVLYSSVESFKAYRSKPKKAFFKFPRELNKYVDHCHVFPTIMSNTTSRDVYAVHIENKETAVIQRVRDSRYNVLAAEEECEVQLGWVVIGYPPSFAALQAWERKTGSINRTNIVSGTAEVRRRGDGSFGEAEIPNVCLGGDNPSTLLATCCISRANRHGRSPGTRLVGMHFHDYGNMLRACVYGK
jgi:hypothetical protein